MSSRYYAEIDTGMTNNTHASLVRLAGEGQRVLELGAASGYMTRVLKERGCDVVAVEYDPGAIDELASIADEVIIGDMNDPAVLERVRGPFDVVLAGDVLEHLLDPLGVLKTVVSKLGPDGAVVISIPNVGHVDLRLALLQGRFDYQETGLLDATHIRFFTHDTFLNLLGRAGLLVVDIDRIIVRAFESELAVPRETVPDAVLAEVMKVPESETYQFVFKAVPDNGDEEVRARSAACVRVSRDSERLRLGEWQAVDHAAAPMQVQLNVARGYLATAEADRDTARSQVAQLTMELEIAREFQQQAERDRDTDRLRMAQLEAALADAATDTGSLKSEVAVARRELVAACIAESKRNSLNTQVAGLTEELMSSRTELAQIKGSRSYALITQYRRVAVRLAPTGSARQSVFLYLTGNRHWK